jgi:hypothetical protein
LTGKELDDDDTNDSCDGHPDVQRFTIILFLICQELKGGLVDT